MVIPIAFLVQSFANVIGAYLQKRYNVKYIILSGALLCLVSVFAASKVKTFSSFMFFYAVLFPFGIGILYWPPIMCGWEWFGHLKGLCSGSILAGYGFGTFIFSFITTAIVNPDDEQRIKDPVNGEMYFSQEVADRVPKMFRVCIILWAVLTLVGVTMI